MKILFYKELSAKLTNIIYDFILKYELIWFLYILIQLQDYFMSNYYHFETN